MIERLEPRVLFTAAPSDLVVTLGADQASAALEWSDNSDDETAFLVSRSTGANFVNIVALPPNTTSFVDTSLRAGYTYSYRIFADGNPISEPSNVASVVTDPDPLPEAPTNLTVALISGGKGKKGFLHAYVTWQDNSDYEWRFVLQRSTDGGATWITWNVNGENDTDYVDTAIQRHRVYMYRVLAYNGTGYSAWSDVAVLRT